MWPSGAGGLWHFGQPGPGEKLELYGLGPNGDAFRVSGIATPHSRKHPLHGLHCLQYATSNPLHIVTGIILEAYRMQPRRPSGCSSTQPIEPGRQPRKGDAAGERARTYFPLGSVMSCPNAVDGLPPFCATCQPKCSNAGPFFGVHSGHWWPAECVLDTPYLTTTKAFGKVPRRDVGPSSRESWRSAHGALRGRD